MNEREYLIAALRLVESFAPLGFENDIISTPGIKMTISTFIVNDDQLMGIRITDSDNESLFVRTQLIPEAVEAAIFYIKNYID